MIREKLKDGPLVIDLTSSQGNAFALLATAKTLSNQLGYSFQEVQDKMTSGDYENLIEVFDSYFGDYVILER
jgi:hypothetical protein